MRRYELMFVIAPGVPDEEVVALSDEYKGMIEEAGATVAREQSWGKRRLAYPIEKNTEGKYQLFFIEADGVNPFPAVEQRMEQNENVLRHLVVRVDTGRLALDVPKEPEPEVTEAAAEEAS